MATVKYVRLKGYAHIGVAVDGRLTLNMCDEKGKPYQAAGLRPIFFSHIPGTPEHSVPKYPENPEVVPPPLNPPIKFLFIEMLAQFSEDDFKKYQPLWDIIEPTLTWDTALDPTQYNMQDMNPTGPPKP